MGSCLGIYIGDRIVKYAKLVSDEAHGQAKVIAYGTKLYMGDKIDSISSIVAATGSNDSPICINLQTAEIHKVEVLKQINKSDLESLIELEILDISNAENKAERIVEHRYVLTDSAKTKENYSANIITAQKPELEKYINNEQDGVNIVSAYYLPYIIDEIAPNNVNNYVIINMNESTEMTIVRDGKTFDVVKLNVGLKKVFDKYPEIVGSYQKAYDMCKTVNVYTDDETANNKELEDILEPALQEALNELQARFDELKIGSIIEKIYITGMVSLFINSDLLFESYFDKSTEKLRPNFIDPTDSSFNMAEVLEATEAFALAYEGLTVLRPQIDLLREKGKFGNFRPINKAKQSTGAKELNFKKKPKITSNTNNLMFGDIALARMKTISIFAFVCAFTIFVLYSGFTVIYGNELDKRIEEVSKRTEELVNNTTLVQNDTDYINSNKEEYESFTSNINEAYRKVVNGEIGKYSTYNVALFLSKISKFIPNDVTITSISSDDNKNITIKAQSNSYASIGYLVSQLRIQGVLNDVSIKGVSHNASSQEASNANNNKIPGVDQFSYDNKEILATIGGELP